MNSIFILGRSLIMLNFTIYNGVFEYISLVVIICFCVNKEFLQRFCNFQP